jgi:hypothetical protein
MEKEARGWEGKRAGVRAAGDPRLAPRPKEREVRGLGSRWLSRRPKNVIIPLVLTAPQGRPATGESPERQGAARRQSLQYQHAFTLLSAREEGLEAGAAGRGRPSRASHSPEDGVRPGHFPDRLYLLADYVLAGVGRVT